MPRMFVLLADAAGTFAAAARAAAAARGRRMPEAGDLRRLGIAPADWRAIGR